MVDGPMKGKQGTMYEYSIIKVLEEARTEPEEDWHDVVVDVLRELLVQAGHVARDHRVDWVQ